MNYSFMQSLFRFEAPLKEAALGAAPKAKPQGAKGFPKSRESLKSKSKSRRSNQGLALPDL